MSYKKKQSSKPGADAEDRRPSVPGIVPVAVVGVGCLFPGSRDLRGFWRDIVAGRDMIGDIPPEYFLVDDFYDPNPLAPDKTYCKTGAFLQPVEFDPMEYGIPPANIPQTDTSQLLALMVAKRVLEDASGGDPGAPDRSRTGVILGVGSGLELLGEMAVRLSRPVWMKSMRDEGLSEGDAARISERILSHATPWKESTFPGLLGNVVAGRIANRYGLGGINCTSDAACASSFSALSQALGELYLGRADMVITGGVDTNNGPFLFVSFSKTPALSMTGDCRPFSDKADGMVLGEGLGMIAVKRLADAERDGDRIYAVIRGVGSSSDGSGTSVYAPLPEGQAAALRRCYDTAGYRPDTVELVEAHGTGTSIGDEVEFKGLSAVFNESGRADRQWCALGSIKSQIGHTKSAAAAASLIKAILAVQHRILPPTIKVERPDPKLDFGNSPFYLNTRSRPWISAGDHPRRASVSSFGFGGTNFHATIEEYRGPGRRAWRQRIVPDELFVFGAGSAAGLARTCRSECAEPGGDGALSFIARTSQESFNPSAPHRLAIVAADGADLAGKVEKALDMIEKNPSKNFSLPGGTWYAAGGADPGPVAFIFPGQGSQYVDMGAHLYSHFDGFQEAWDEAGRVLMKEGMSLHEIVFPRPAFTEAESALLEETLTRTRWAQPAVCLTGIAASRVLKSLGIMPRYAGGHSLGELTALHEAGALGLEGVMRSARARGEIMARAPETPGAMTAAAGPAEKIQRLLDEWGGGAVIANHNGPAQAVLSGTVAEIEEAERRLGAEKIATRRLRVSAAFHSRHMDGACGPFGEFLAGIRVEEPRIPAYSNAAGAVYPESGKDIRDLLVRQLNRPVRFAEMIETMYADGARTFIEPGPGNGLTGMVRSILEGRPHHAVCVDARKRHGITSLWNALGELAAAGAAIDFSPIWENNAPVEDPRKRKKPKFTVTLMGTNYGKGYPVLDGSQTPRPPQTPLRGTLRPSVMGRSELTSQPQQAPQNHQGSQTSRTPQTPQRGALRPSVNGENPPQGGVGGSSDALGSTGEWLAVFREIQRQNAETHIQFQKIMAESHQAFLNTAGNLNRALGEMLAGRPLPSEFSAPAPDAYNFQPFSMHNPADPAPAVRPMTAEPDAAGSTGVQAVPAGIDFEEMLMTIVADKTGYPRDILTPEMRLEDDLGIDSIKRVEILSSVKDENPWLPEVDPADMMHIKTLGDVVEFIQRFAGEASPAVTSSGPDSAAASVKDTFPGLAAGGAAIPVGVDFKDMLLSIVSDKTGYPKEILALEMALEADLGIDSIKRVEIFSAIMDENPWIPEIDPAAMIDIKTLGDVLNFIETFLEEIKKKGTAEAGLNGAAPANEGGRADSRGPRPRRLVPEAVPAPPTGFSVKGIAPGATVSITDDGRGVAAALAAILNGKGMDARVAADPPDDAGAVIFLGGLADIDDENAALAVNRAAFIAAKRIAPRFAAAGGAFVTVQDTGGDFGLSGRAGARAGLAGLAGLAKCAAIEWPGAGVKAIDLERGERPPEELARLIAAELLDGGPEIEVGLPVRRGRVRLECVPRELPSSSFRSPNIGPDSVIVASGGGRGITAASLIELARSYRPRLVLLGRTRLVAEDPSLAGARTDAEVKRVLVERARTRGESILPADIGTAARAVQACREIGNTLRELEKAGSPARYLPVDVLDAAALRDALSAIRAEWGPITGIVHGAGVLNDKLIADKTPEQFDRVFSVKVRGLRSLLDATAGDPVSVICIFSSVAARYGNRGQSDYAMANEVLNRIARAEARKRGAECMVKSINWGPWEGGMVSGLLKQQFTRLGIPLIEPGTGAKLMVDEITGPAAGCVEVVIGPAPPRPFISAGDAGPALECPVLVDRERYPYLDGHRVNDSPVVPAALVLEWFARAARLRSPGQSRFTCRDLAVLRGVRLEKFDQGVEAFTVTCRGRGPVLSLELSGSQGPPRYTADFHMIEPVPGTAAADPRDARGPWTLDLSSLYREHLFHGRDFQVITSLDGISGPCAAATLKGVRLMEWPGHWVTDAAALDGCLQVARLWGIERTGRPSLPARIGEYIHYGAVPSEGLYRCVMKARLDGANRLVSDMELYNSDGLLAAELRGVEMYLQNK